MAIAKPGYDMDQSINLGHAERLASLVGGALLGFMGARRGTMVGATMAMAGGALVMRGLTGYCPVTRALSASSSSDLSALEPPPGADDAVLAVDIEPSGTEPSEREPVTADQAAERPASRFDAV